MQAISDHRFATLSDAKAYALAGNATVTLQSLRTGIHFTYKIRAKERSPHSPWSQQAPVVHFVSLLNGADNENDYQYLGMIANGEFRATKGSRVGLDTPSFKAFSYFWNARELPQQLVVRHEGRCGRCGRTLTVPESIDAGIGPECASKIESVL